MSWGRYSGELYTAVCDREICNSMPDIGKELSLFAIGLFIISILMYLEGKGKI